MPMVIGVVVVSFLLHALIGGVPLAHSAVTLLAVLLMFYRLRNTQAKSPFIVTADCHPAFSVDGLLNRTHEKFTSQLNGANDDLAQVQSLLSDAIEKLLASFSGMHQLIEAQRELSTRSEHFSSLIRANIVDVHTAIAEAEKFISEMATMDAQFVQQSKARLDATLTQIQQSNRRLSGVLVKQDEVSAQVDQVVSAAVTSLQFQDMVGQLLEHSRLRLDTMQTAWQHIDELAKREQSGVVLSRVEIERASQEISAVFARAEQVSARTPVRQNKMDIGDIELF